MHFIRIRKLFERYRKGNASELESAKIESWYNDLEIGSPLELTGEQLRTLEENVFHFPNKSRKYRLSWPQVAASILAVISAGALLSLWLLRSESEPRVIAETDYQPAEGQIILSIDDVQYNLDPMHDGIEVTEDGIAYLGQPDGEIGSLSQSTPDAPLARLHQQAPRRLSLRNAGGRLYKVRLPDGTLIWMNADTRIDYPERFDSQERVVKLIGEAYFDVSPGKAGNTNRPFIVETMGQRIKVLGTKFNVRAYDENPIVSTTLLEGQVTVSPANDADFSRTLAPNQQSICDKQTGEINILEVDPQIATAWMQGLFSFEEMALEDIMAEIRRWYNMEVVFDQESIRKEKFGGTIPRDASLSDVLHILTLTETVKFKIESEERRVRVMK